VSLFVTCYDAGEVYVIDPWVPRVRNVIPVGRGPIATVLPPSDVSDPDDAYRAYVVGFGGNNVMVVDLNPSSVNRYRVIQRIGFSSPTPRQVGPQ
jgi:DNA-binding beta-propeller fold protein YncE